MGIYYILQNHFYSYYYATVENLLSRKGRLWSAGPPSTRPSINFSTCHGRTTQEGLQTLLSFFQTTKTSSLSPQCATLNGG